MMTPVARRSIGDVARRLARKRKKFKDNQEVMAAIDAVDARKRELGVDRQLEGRVLLRRFERFMREGPCNVFGCYLEPLNFNPCDLSEQTVDLY